MDIVERFKRYIAVDTKSDPNNGDCPSTAGQLELGKLLVAELHDLGVQNAEQDEHGYVYASIPANTTTDAVPIGFIAHMDTSPDLDGKCTHPQIVDYAGGDIRLNEKYSLTVKDFPFLNDLIGQKIMTTDGTTLLGADDKAGVAIIMSAVEHLMTNPEIKHGEIKIGFTPDEEIGRGADKFDVARFGAEFAYTIDGGELGELEYENFNAAGAKIFIEGKNVHPGSAKNTMINALDIARELTALLPEQEKPQYTDGYEGFFLLTELTGTVDTASMQYIIRDHSREKFEQKKALLKAAVDFLNVKFENRITLDMSDTYYNMREKIEPHMHIIALAEQAMKQVNIEPITRPIRGGTDGSRLSYMGLPCPNIFAGGYNFHGRFECLPLASLSKGKELLVKIAELHCHK